MLNEAEVIEIVKTDSKKYLTPVRVIAGLVVIIGVVILFAWCSSSSETNLPKAEELNKQSANAHIESVKSEANANVTAAQVTAIDAKRQDATRISRAASDAAKKDGDNLKIRKAEYDKVRKTVRATDDSNLDARERRLQSDLNQLYPDH